MLTPGPGVVRYAAVVLREELAAAAVPASLVVPSMVDAVAEMLRHPRSSWAAPVNSWERACHAVALTAVRIEGDGHTRRVAVHALREAIEAVAEAVA